MPIHRCHVGYGLCLALLCPWAAWSAPVLPPTAELQRLHDVLRTNPAPASLDTISLTTLPSAKVEADNAREDTRFTLAEVELRGVTQLSPTVFLPLFEPLTGQQTSLAALDRAVESITALYRKKGYLLSRAFLPQQTVSNGRVVIQVVEGTLDAVTLAAPDTVKTNPLVQQLLARIPTGKPVTEGDIETTLLQLNDIPGIAASGQLSPGSTPGAAALTIRAAESKGDAALAFSNHGTRYLGPNRLEGQINLHNLLAPYGDTLTLQTLNTPTFRDLLFLQGRYSLPLNQWGTSLEASAYRGLSRPQYTLALLDIESRATGGSLKLNQRLTRSRAKTLDIYGLLDIQEAESTTLGNLLNTDHSRTLRVGTTLTTLDDLQGLTTTNIEVSKGLNLFNATKAYDLGASRLRGRATDFTKLNANLTRLQRLNENWNLLLAGSGQFSTHALLAGEEFGVGGETFGRGYDAGEIIGEQGLAARSELQLTFHPAWPWLQAYQLFGFYDYGMVWNKDRDPLESDNARTLSSVGYGVRLTFTPELSAELMVAKPMTRIVQTTGGKDPSILFRLKSKVDFETIGNLSGKGGAS
ncbi:MAG: ShlB/FhaC/HecB family hemolysin secretion/activation protein [Pseudomonadaceae bacterium]|nr:ShlB/FhaC/HecB family hemolysin secretion/activation protein [Pseudomonadaceae bacterium]